MILSPQILKNTTIHPKTNITTVNISNNQILNTLPLSNDIPLLTKGSGLRLPFPRNCQHSQRNQRADQTDPYPRPFFLPSLPRIRTRQTKYHPQISPKAPKTTSDTTKLPQNTDFANSKTRSGLRPSIGNL